MDNYFALKIQIQQNIKEQRKKHKMTQEELSKKLNKSRFWVTAIERGNIIPTIIGLYQIADSLNCSVYEILPANLGKNVISPNIDAQITSQIVKLLNETQKEIQNEII